MKSLRIDQKSLNSSDELAGLLPDIHKELIDLSAMYPGFQNWYEQKVIPGIYAGERSLILEMRSDVIAGLAILKNDGHEKKLCCLRVMDDFQKKAGIGYKLFERSMEELETRHPLLSVGEERLDEFNRIFNHFGFKKSWEYPNLYRPKKLEISFNGILGTQKRFVIKSSPLFFTTKSFTNESCDALPAF